MIFFLFQCTGMYSSIICTQQVGEFSLRANTRLFVENIKKIENKSEKLCI